MIGYKETFTLAKDNMKNTNTGYGDLIVSARVILQVHLYYLTYLTTWLTQ